MSSHNKFRLIVNGSKPSKTEIKKLILISLILIVAGVISLRFPNKIALILTLALIIVLSINGAWGAIDRIATRHSSSGISKLAVELIVILIAFVFLWLFFHFMAFLTVLISILIIVLGVLLLAAGIRSIFQ